MSDAIDPQVAMQARFLTAERMLVEWWGQRPKAEVIKHFGEWFVLIDGRRFSISDMALAVAQEGG